MTGFEKERTIGEEGDFRDICGSFLILSLVIKLRFETVESLGVKAIFLFRKISNLFIFLVFLAGLL